MGLAESRGYPPDYYNISLEGSSAGLLHGPAVGGWTLEHFRLQLVDPTHTAFASDALPMTTLNPLLFAHPNLTYMSLGFRGPNGEHSSVLANYSNLPPDVALTSLIASLSDPALGLKPGKIASFTDKLSSAMLSYQTGQFKQAKNQINAFLRLRPPEEVL